MCHDLIVQSYSISYRKPCSDNSGGIKPYCSILNDTAVITDADFTTAKERRSFNIPVSLSLGAMRLA